MQPTMDIAVVVFEEENNTTLTAPFLHAAAQLEIANLYLLSPDYLSDLPADLKFEAPGDDTELEQRLLLIRKAADIIQSGLKLSKKQLDLKVEKPTIIVHNFGIFKALKQKYDCEKERLVDEFNAQMKRWEQAAGELMASYWEDQTVIDKIAPFPQLEMPDSIELMLFDAEVSTQCCISGYLQVFDDSAVVDYIKDENFNDLMQKLNISMYELPRPTEFAEDQLFEYVYNPYEEKKEIEWKEFIRIPEKPDEEGTKKKKKTEKKHKEDGFFGADGSLILMKVLKFINDNSFQRKKEDDITLYTAPCFQVRDYGKFIEYYKASIELPKVTTVTQKEEKQFMTQCKARFDDNLLGQAKIAELILTIDKISESGDFYKQFLRHNRVVSWGPPPSDLKLLHYFDGDKTVRTDRIVELGKAPSKPQKGMENITRMCRITGLLEDKIEYLRRLAEDNEFTTKILEQIAECRQPQSLNHYSSLLDKLPFEEQNHVSSIVEAMICELEYEPITEDEQSSRQPKRALSAKKSEEAERPTKIDKNAPPPPEIPFNDANVFGLSQKDMGIYNITLDYNDAPQQINSSLVKAMQGILYEGDAFLEVSTKIVEDGLELVVLQDKEEEEDELFVNEFAERANNHDLRVVEYYSRHITDFKNRLIRRLQEEQRVEWEARKAEYQRQKKEEQDANVRDGNVSTSVIEDANDDLLTNEYDGEYKPIEICVDDYFDFSHSEFENSAVPYLTVEHRNCIFAVIGEFFQFDASCDANTNLFRICMDKWQTARPIGYNQSHLLNTFKDSLPRLFETVPCFNIFINNSVVEQMLLKGHSIPKVARLQERFILPRLSDHGDACSEVSQPLFVSSSDALDVSSFAGNLCLFNYFNVNIEEAIDSLLGTVAFVHDYDFQPLKEFEEQTSSARSSSARSTKGKERNQVYEPEIEPVIAVQHDPKQYYYTKYTQEQQEGFNDVELGTKLQTKLELPFSELPDIDVEIPSIAPEYDLHPADFKPTLLTDSDALGLHFVVNSPASGMIEHTILNIGCEAMRFVLEQSSSEEKVIGQVGEPEFNTPSFNTGIIGEWLEANEPESLRFPDPPNTDGLTVKELKQLKDLEAQQLAELKKRKKRAEDMAAICKDISESRTAAVEAFNGKDVVGLRPSNAFVSSFIVNSGVRIYAEDGKFVYRAEDMIITADTQHVLFVLEKDFYDLDLDQLGLYDNFENGDFLNTLLCLRDKVGHLDLKHISLIYKISLEAVDIKADITSKSGVSETIQLFSQRFDQMTDISEQLEHDSVIEPKTGSKYREECEETKVVTAIERIADNDIKARELFQLSWAVLLPELEENSRTINHYFKQKGIASVAACSKYLEKRRYTELLDLGARSYTEQEHFLNVLEGLKSKKDQILKQNPSLLSGKVSALAKDEMSCSFLVELPFGAEVLVDENGSMKVVLACSDFADHFVIQRGHASFVFSDNFEVGCVDGGMYLSDIKGTLGKSVQDLQEGLENGLIRNCWFYGTKNLCLRSTDMEISLGEPNRPFETEPRDPHDFVAPRDLILRLDEMPAKSLLCFTSGAKNQRVEDYRETLPYSFYYSPRELTRSLRTYFEIQDCEGIPVSNVVVCDEIKSTIISITSRAPELVAKHFSDDFEIVQKALTRVVPKYQRPLFIKTELRQPQIERNFRNDSLANAQVDTARTDGSHESDVAEQPTRLPKASDVLETVRQDVHQPIKLDFGNKFRQGRCYWQSPEGRLFEKDNEDNTDYFAQIQAFEDLSTTALNEGYSSQRMCPPAKNVSGNLFQKALAHHRRTTIPSALKPIEQPKQVDRPLPTIRKTKRDLDINTIIDYALMENQALAGVNVSYLDREKSALRRTKNASAAFSGADSRQLLLEPNSVNILITPEELERMRAQSGEKPYFDLFYALKATNVGRESLHLRWHRGAISNSNIYDVEIITKKGGIPPGLSTRITIEFRIDFSIEEGETLDAVVFRTEEEIIAVPVVIFHGEEEQEVLIEERPPRVYSEHGEALRGGIAAVEGGLDATTAEVVECVEQSAEYGAQSGEQSAEEDLDGDYEAVDLGEIEEMNGFGGDDIASGTGEVQAVGIAGSCEMRSDTQSFEEIED